MSKTILNILNLPGESVKADILEDGIWQKAIIKDFNTSSAFWNRASIISISKAYVNEAPAALIYLLQKETKSLFLWEEKWGPVTPALNDFIVSLSTWGRFSKNTGETMSIEAFWNCYSYTIEGLISEPTFEFKVDQIVQPYDESLDKKDIQKVIGFDNEWNEKNFLVETNMEWVLFSWLTIA